MVRNMQWWNDFMSWLSSDDGWRVISTAVIPFVAILVAGVLAALIARASSKRILAFQDREIKAAAVMALIGAGRKATVWSSLGGDEKQRVDNQLSEADIRIRLLPVNGANAAGDWAAHELAAMKKNSASFSFQAEQTFVEYRDRLLEWQNKPKRARKLFAYDLEQWRYEDEAVDKSLVQKQQEWAAKNVEDKEPVRAPAAPAPTETVAAAATSAAATPAAAPAASSAIPMPAAAEPIDEPAPAASPPVEHFTATSAAADLEADDYAQTAVLEPLPDDYVPADYSPDSESVVDAHEEPSPDYLADDSSDNADADSDQSEKDHDETRAGLERGY